MTHTETLRTARDALLAREETHAQTLGLGIYRTLVRGRLGAMVREGYPGTLRCAGNTVLDGWVTDWLAECPPTAREVHRVLVDFGDAVLARDVDSACGDVVRYERAMVLAANALDTGVCAETVSPTDLALQARTHASATVLDLAWDIPGWLGGTEILPRARRMSVGVYRDRDDCVRALELGTIAARLVRALTAGMPTLGDAVTVAVADGDVPSVEQIADLLEDLAARGVLVLGSASPQRNGRRCE